VVGRLAVDQVLEVPVPLLHLAGEALVLGHLAVEPPLGLPEAVREALGVQRTLVDLVELQLGGGQGLGRVVVAGGEARHGALEVLLLRLVVVEDQVVHLRELLVHLRQHAGLLPPQAVQVLQAAVQPSLGLWGAPGLRDVIVVAPVHGRAQVVDLRLRGGQRVGRLLRGAGEARHVPLVPVRPGVEPALEAVEALAHVRAAVLAEVAVLLLERLEGALQRVTPPPKRGGVLLAGVYLFVQVLPHAPF